MNRATRRRGALLAVLGLLAGLIALSGGAGAQEAAGTTAEDAVAVDVEPAPVAPAPQPEVVPDQYVVSLDASILPEDVPAEAQRLVAEVGGELLAELPETVNGFAVEVDPAGRAALDAAPEVANVADNTVVTGTAVTVTTLAPCLVCTPPRPEELWNLDRVDQRVPATRDNSFSYEFDGTGVDLYVIDSGLRPQSVYFGGRASIVGDTHALPVVSPPSPWTPNNEPNPANPINTGGLECNGHGTHVAGTAGGNQYGVARDVTVKAVRVLSCNNQGSDATVTAGIELALDDADGPDAGNRVDGPTVLNLSLEGGFGPGETVANEPIAMAVQSAIDRGATVVVAAGNGATDACSRTPAAVPGAITVGATNQGDERASFSNSGPCIDVWAPGDQIWSVSHVEPSGSDLIYTNGAFISRKNGTSMAAPLVAGVAAMFLESFPTATPAQVRTAITSSATRGALTGIGAAAPNLLVWHGPTTFGDAGFTNPFFQDIEWMAAEGISTGTAASPKPLYKPADAVSRQAMSAFMYRLAGEPAFSLPSASTFGDVSLDHPFALEVEWMASEGITTGTAASPKPLYKPADAVSRQAMSAFMYRLAGEPAFSAPGTSTFGDVSTAHPFFREVEWMASEGITTGTAASPKPLYKPGTPVSRQAMAAFMRRLADGPGVGI